MPDRYKFDHLPDQGNIGHRCIECGWPDPERFVNEKERAAHHKQHEREQTNAAEARRRDNLAKAHRAQRQLAQEAAVINERFGAPTREGGKTMADDATKTENGQIAAELEAQLKGLPAKLVEKKAYHRIDQNGVTLGYVYLGVRKPSVEVPLGNGGYERVSLTTSADIPLVLSKLTAVAERAAAKKAAAAEPKAKPEKAEPKAEAEAKPDPKPKTRKSRAKATA